MADTLPSHVMHANPLTGSVFSPLTLFESTITNAQMLVESMAERELFSALRIIGNLHSHVVLVMEPRYGRLCERSDHLAQLESGSIRLTAATASSSMSSAAVLPGGGAGVGTGGFAAKEEKMAVAGVPSTSSTSVLGSALSSIKMEILPDDPHHARGAAASASVATVVDESELIEEDADDEDDDDDCIITDYFEDGSFGAGGGSYGPPGTKMPRLADPGGGADVPAECKTIMRRAYKSLKGNGPHLFDFSLPFSHDLNQRVAAQVTAKAKEMAQGKSWPSDIWQKLPYGSRSVMVFQDFRQKMRHRLKHIKLNRRQKSFELVATSLTSDELEKFRVILTREYTSSDEECGSGGSDQLRVRELAWESDEVKRLKRQLDQVYSDNCATTKQKQQLSKCIRDPMRSRSQRLPPDGAPTWALKVSTPGTRKAT